MLFQQKKALIISDFDGTICQVDMGNAVLSRFTKKNWNEIDRKYIQGTIGSRAAYGQIAPLIKGNRDEMREFVLSKAKMVRGFLPFYRLCRKKDLDIKILSDGLDFYIAAILESKGFADIEYYSNVVAFGDGDTVAITHPQMNELCGRCGTCKNAILQSFRLRYEQIIYIGDGHSDVCPSRSADLVFARGVLLEKCKQENIPCIPFDDFKTIHQYLNAHIR